MLKGIHICLLKKLYIHSVLIFPSIAALLHSMLGGSRVGSLPQFPTTNNVAVVTVNRARVTPPPHTQGVEKLKCIHSTLPIRDNPRLLIYSVRQCLRYLWGRECVCVCMCVSGGWGGGVPCWRTGADGTWWPRASRLSWRWEIRYGKVRRCLQTKRRFLLISSGNLHLLHENLQQLHVYSTPFQLVRHKLTAQANIDYAHFYTLN